MSFQINRQQNIKNTWLHVRSYGNPTATFCVTLSHPLSLSLSIMVTHKRQQQFWDHRSSGYTRHTADYKQDPTVYCKQNVIDFLTLRQVQYITIHIEALVTACQLQCTLRTKFTLKE
jgi:hypothetical protein